MSKTLPTLNEFRQHAVLQALTTSYNQHLNQLTKINGLSDTLWLACSGGRDSLGLAYACVLVGIPVRLIHINHNLQTQADEWQQRVKDYAEKWSLPFEAYSVFLENKTEVAARDARFAAIFSNMQDGHTLLLGHHADDQAETILMNLCKGSGLKGLSGMATWSTRDVSHDINKKSVNLWRPWLDITRAQITDFVTQAQLDFVDDPTNITITNTISRVTQTDDNNLTNTRAFMRSQVFPQLTSQWPRVINNMSRTAKIVAEAENILTQQTRADLQIASTSVDTMDVEKLLTLTIERQYRVIASWMQGNEMYAPPRDQVDAVHQLALSKNTEQQAQLNWHDIQVRRFKNQLYRLPKQIDIAEIQSVTLNESHQIKLPCGEWQVVKTTTSMSGLPLHLLGKPLRLRPRILGERLHIAGRVGSWPLKKFFQSQRIAPWQRDQAHVLQVDEQDIALICHAGFFLLNNATLLWEQEDSSEGSSPSQVEGWLLKAVHGPT